MQKDVYCDLSCFIQVFILVWQVFFLDAGGERQSDPHVTTRSAISSHGQIVDMPDEMIEK
jgi:hypothetical protein